MGQLILPKNRAAVLQTGRTAEMRLRKDTGLRNVQSWAVRKHGQVEYNITQLLSVRGYMRQFLSNFGRVEGRGPLSFPGVSCNAEHTRNGTQ